MSHQFTMMEMITRINVQGFQLHECSATQESARKEHANTEHACGCKVKLRVVTSHNQPPVTSCLCLLSFSRAGKGVFSAMKLGKIKMSKDDHKNRGKVALWSFCCLCFSKSALCDVTKEYLDWISCLLKLFWFIMNDVTIRTGPGTVCNCSFPRCHWSR